MIKWDDWFDQKGIDRTQRYKCETVTEGHIILYANYFIFIIILILVLRHIYVKYQISSRQFVHTNRATNYSGK